MLHIWGVSVSTNCGRIWRDLGMPARRKKAISLFWVIPLHGEDSQSGQSLGTRIGPSKTNRNGVIGIPRKHLEEKVKALADQGEWSSFIDVLVLLVFGVVLFSNMDGLVDLAVIYAFLAYHHSKESPVVAVLADAYDTFDWRCEKSGARIVCCTPALYVRLVSHLFRHESRPVCLLQGHRMCTEKREVNWEQLLTSMHEASINWFPLWKEGEPRVLSSCEGFSNIPLMGTRGCINYNLVLAIR